MPDTFNSIFGIRALVMQLLDYHPYCSDHLVPLHCLPSLSLRPTGLYALCRELPRTGHIDSGHCFKSTHAKRVPKKRVLVDTGMNRQANDFTTCQPSNNAIANGGRLLRLLGLRLALMQVVHKSIALVLLGCHLPIYSPTSCFGEKWRCVRSILQKAPVGLTARFILDEFFVFKCWSSWSSCGRGLARLRLVDLKALRRNPARNKLSKLGVASDQCTKVWGLCTNAS